MSREEMAIDPKRLQAEFPELLELLENVAGYVGDLDLAKAREVPVDVFSDLCDVLRRALAVLDDLFVLRGETPPAPEPGIAFGSLGPSLRRTLPQRLAAQLADELNAVPSNRPEDLSQFAALGLHARVSDLLRFVAYVKEERMADLRRVAPPTLMSGRRAKENPPFAAEPLEPVRQAAPATVRAAVATPPPRASGPGPDLSAYGIRIDEAGERVDAGSATVWYASAAGPRATGEGLAASFAVAFPGGVAFAVAEGTEASLGARLSSVVAVRAFCRSAAANPSAPEAAVRTAQNHLDLLLSALVSAGDETEAFTMVRGSIPAANARRILMHTRQPDEALRRVSPALATSLVGAVAVPSGSTFRVSVVRLGAGCAESRIEGKVAPLLGCPGTGSVPLLGPGACGAEDVGRTETVPPMTLCAGGALLLGTPALATGTAGPWDGLATLWPPFPEGLTTGQSARDLLRRAERWGATEPSHFAGPLGFAFFLAR